MKIIDLKIYPIDLVLMLGDADLEKSKNKFIANAKEFELNNNDAEHISHNLIPAVVHQLISKTNDPNDDSFNIQGLLSNLGGNGLGGMLMNMFSSYKK